MPQISKLAIQKNHPNRRSLYLDGTFIIGIDELVVYKYNLLVGDEVDNVLLEKIIFEESFRKAKDISLRFLSYRGRSKKEITDKLKNNKFNNEITEKVINELERLNYIDDEDFAGMFARDTMRNRPMGEQRLRRELYQKGISNEIINSTVEKIFEQVNPLEISIDLVKKRLYRYSHPNKDKTKRRIIDFLKRKGFEWEVIRKTLDRYSL